MTDLKHVGVLGMKWGIRKRGPASSDHSKAREVRKKHVSELSNDELKTVINRMQLEKQYKDLSAASVSKGSKIVQSILTGLAAQAINQFVRQKAGPQYEVFTQFAQAVRNKAKG